MGAGKRHVVDLPPGTYSVTFVLPGFATFVEAWVATSPDVAESFAVSATYGGEPRYVLLRRTR